MSGAGPNGLIHPAPVNIDTLIREVRGQRVILDLDLARIYGVPTKRLNEQVKRNAQRFPNDFAFQLTVAEKAGVVANCDHLIRLKFSHVLPYAFTEHDAIMAANVLNSPQAVQMSVLLSYQRRPRALPHPEKGGPIMIPANQVKPPRPILRFRQWGKGFNELTGASRSGTLTVAGTTGQRKATFEWDSYGVTKVTVSGTGLASGNAEVYSDRSWAMAAPAALGSSMNTAVHSPR